MNPRTLVALEEICEHGKSHIDGKSLHSHGEVVAQIQQWSDGTEIILGDTESAAKFRMLPKLEAKP